MAGAEIAGKNVAIARNAQNGPCRPFPRAAMSRRSSPWTCSGRQTNWPRNGAGPAKSIVHMELGQPAVPPPASVLDAAKRSLDSGSIGYTEALGITALRERIAQYYQDYYGVSVSPARIVVTTGSSGRVPTRLPAGLRCRRVCSRSPIPAIRPIAISCRFSRSSRFRCWQTPRTASSRRRISWTRRHDPSRAGGSMGCWSPARPTRRDR